MRIESTAERPGGIRLQAALETAANAATSRTVARHAARQETCHAGLVAASFVQPREATTVRRSLVWLLLGSPSLGGALAFGCAPSVPHPPFRPQNSDVLVVVDFGPPPGRVETIPKRPPGASAWVDGEWIRRRGRWYWLVGRWVNTPPGWTYSPWVTVRAPDGTVYYAPSIWKDAEGRAMHAPPPLALATASGAAVLTPEGDLESTGRNLETAPAPPIVPPPLTAVDGGAGDAGDAGFEDDGADEPPEAGVSSLPR